MANIQARFSMKSALSHTTYSDRAIEISEDLRQKLQSILLSIYQDVYEVCEKLGVKLFLCGGSALGAVRHKGFIPWDDDLDVSMTRADYIRFRDAFEEELSDRYVLCAPDYKNGSRTRFPKVMKKGTLFREMGNPSPEEECGVFLDIFIIDNIPNNKLIRSIKGTRCNLLEFISGQVLLHEENATTVLDEIKKASKGQYLIRKAIGVLFSLRKVRSWNRILDKAVQYKKETKDQGLPTGRKHYFGEILPKEVFLPGSEGVFEGQKVLLFSNPDAYLSNLYGDYMRIPNEGDRERHVVEEIRL